jgi:hypothetical protein
MMHMQVSSLTADDMLKETINYELLEAPRSHPMTDMAVDQFAEDNKGIYDIEF